MQPLNQEPKASLQVTIDNVLVMPHGKLLVLWDVRKRGEQALKTRVLFDRSAVVSYGLMMQVIIRCNATRGGRLELEIVYDLDAPRLGELADDAIDHLREVEFDGTRGHLLETIIAWVLLQAAVEIGPREIIHGILLGLKRVRYNLGHDVVIKGFMQARLDGKWLMKELLVEVLFRIVHENTRNPRVVELWAPLIIIKLFVVSIIDCITMSRCSRP